METRRSISLSYISIEAKKLFLEKDLIFIKVLEGSVLIEKNIEGQILKKGDIMAIHPGTCFLLCERGEHNLVAFLRIDTYIARDFEKGAGPRIYHANSAKYESLHPEVYKKLRYTLESITRYEIFENKKALHQHLRNLFYLLLNHFNFVTCGITHKKFGKKILHRYTEVYKLFFRSNRRSSLKDITEFYKLNYDHMRKDILERYGYTYNHLKDYVRVSRAVRYMLETDLTITEISYKVGFSDHKYMVDRFKKWYGMTPSKLKKLSNDKTNAFMSYVKIL